MIFKLPYYFFLTLLMLAFSFTAKAQQNLVPNGSFEIFSEEPNWINECYKATGWNNVNGSFSATSHGSPDYFSLNGSGPVKLPDSYFGKVFPFEGTKIMGFATYSSQNNNQREYISTELNSKLQLKTSYIILFKLTNGIIASSNLSSNNIGLKFSKFPLTQTGWQLISTSPEIEITSIINDTNWVNFSFCFIPQEEFNYITFGNFRTDANTQTISRAYTNNTINGAYYFIDDISIVIDTSILQILADRSGICINDSVTLSSTLKENISWFNVANPNDTFSNNDSIVVAPLVTTTYVVKNTTESDTITIVVNPKPTVDFGNDTLVCSGSSVSLNATSPGSTYLWNNNSSSSTISVSNPGTYWVDVTNTSGCTSRDSIEINHFPFPVIDLGIDTSLCDGDSLLLEANYSGASYLWQDGNENSSIVVNSPGVYWIKLTDSICSFTDTIFITYINQASVNLGNDTLLCAGKSLLLNLAVPGGTYLWQNGSSLSFFNVSTPGTYHVRVTANNCSSFDTVVVAYRPNPLVSLGNDTALCAGDSVVMDVFAPGLSYIWNDGSTSSSFTAYMSGDYSVSVADSLCSASDNRLIIFKDYPFVDLGNDTALCGNTPFEITNINDTCSACTYQWQDGSVFKNFNANESGIYSVDVTSYGCTSRDSIDLTFYDYPVISLGNDTNLCPDELVVLNALSEGFEEASYLWQDGSALTSYTAASKSGLYWVRITDNNCSASDSVWVSMEECELSIPNVITPNGDGKNDFFVITGNVAPLKVRIYNRWGKSMFDAPAYLNDWDADGLSDGVYFYIIISLSSEISYKGVVEVLR